MNHLAFLLTERLTYWHATLFPQDQPLGSWRLTRQVDGGEEVTYKFSPKFILKAGQSVTVRSKP